jgi:iron complex outermembrane receptor protein
MNDVGRGGFIPDYRQWAGALWATERWKNAEVPWEVEAGLRYDLRRTRAVTTGSLRNLDTLVHFGSASATGGIAYRFNNVFKILLNSGYVWRPPHVNELFARGVHHAIGTYEEGSPLLVPERAWNTQLNAQYEGGRFTGFMTLYRNSVQNFIYLQPLADFVLTVRGAFPAYRYQQAQTLLYGIDAGGGFAMRQGWTVEGRFSTLRAARSASVLGLKRDWLPLMPADRGQYALKWTPLFGKQCDKGAHGQTYIRVTGTIVARQRRIPDEGLLKAPPAAFHLLSIDGAYAFSLGKQRMEMGFDVQNMTNKRYREYLNFFRFFTDEPGFNFSGRIKLHF